MKAIRFKRVVCTMMLSTAFAVAISGCSATPTVNAQLPAAINSILFGHSQMALGGSDPVGTTLFMEQGIGDPVSQDVYSIPMPSHAVLSHLHFATIANTLGGVVTTSVYVNGAPTMISCAITAPDLVCSDTTHSITVNEGDLVTIAITLTSISNLNSGFVGPQWRASVGVAFE